MVVFFRSAFDLLAQRRGSRARACAARATSPAPGAVWRDWRDVLLLHAIAHMPGRATLLNTPRRCSCRSLRSWLGNGTTAAVGHSAIGFVGLLFILKPGLALFRPVALIRLASGYWRRSPWPASANDAHRVDPAHRVLFHRDLDAVSAVPLAWSWTTPPAELWGLLIATGAGDSPAAVTRAYAQRPPPRSAVRVRSWCSRPDRLGAVGRGARRPVAAGVTLVCLAASSPSASGAGAVAGNAEAVKLLRRPVNIAHPPVPWALLPREDGIGGTSSHSPRPSPGGEKKMCTIQRPDR